MRRFEERANCLFERFATQNLCIEEGEEMGWVREGAYRQEG